MSLQPCFAVPPPFPRASCLFPVSSISRASSRRISSLRPRCTLEPPNPTTPETPSPPSPPSPPTPPPATDAPVPGKITLSAEEITQQRIALEKYTAELRKERIKKEIEDARLFGWVPYAETLNGRLAMFFLMTGLLTEYWTGYSIPEQVELLARTLGVL